MRTRSKASEVWDGWLKRKLTQHLCQKISDKNVFANWDENTCACVRTCMHYACACVCIRVHVPVCVPIRVCVREAKPLGLGVRTMRETLAAKYLLKIVGLTGR